MTDFIVLFVFKSGEKGGTLLSYNPELLLGIPDFSPVSHPVFPGGNGILEDVTGFPRFSVRKWGVEMETQVGQMRPGCGQDSKRP